MNKFSLVVLIAITCIANVGSAADNSLSKPTALQRFVIEMNRSLNARSETIANFNDGEPGLEHKSKGKALFRSLVLPGAGERYLGKKSLGKAFLISEVTLWIGFFAFREYGKWIKSDAHTYAADHSGAVIDDKPSQFFVNLGLYDDVDQYNDAQQRMRNFDKVYSDPSYFWSWDSPDNRRRYERMRIASDRAVNRSVLVLGGILANHLISAIDAVWQTHLYNKRLTKQAQGNIKVDVKVDLNGNGISLNFKKLF